MTIIEQKTKYIADVTSLQDQYRQLLNLELEKKALFLLTTIKVVFSLAKDFSISPISLFFH